MKGAVPDETRPSTNGKIAQCQPTIAVSDGDCAGSLLRVCEPAAALDEDHGLSNGARVMAYMLLMMEPVGQRQARTEAEGREAYARMVRWGESLKQRGLLLAAESLRSQASASRVQLRGGLAHVTDGPFAETKEMIGGFFLIDCATHERALAIAQECPAAEWLTVEVRGIAACFEESQAAAS